MDSINELNTSPTSDSEKSFESELESKSNYDSEVNVVYSSEIDSSESSSDSNSDSDGELDISSISILNLYNSDIDSNSDSDSDSGNDSGNDFSKSTDKYSTLKKIGSNNPSFSYDTQEILNYLNLRN